jgi:anti-anti-sigma factor
VSLAQVSVEHHHGVPAARVRGDVDAANARSVMAELEASLSNRVPGLVVDLSEAGYLDSTGMSVLFELRKRLRHRRQTLTLVVDPASGLARALAIGGVLDAIAHRATLDEAIAHSAG